MAYVTLPSHISAHEQLSLNFLVVKVSRVSLCMASQANAPCSGDGGAGGRGATGELQVRAPLCLTPLKCPLAR